MTDERLLAQDEIVGCLVEQLRIVLNSSTSIVPQPHAGGKWAAISRQPVKPAANVRCTLVDVHTKPGGTSFMNVVIQINDDPKPWPMPIEVSRPDSESVPYVTASQLARVAPIIVEIWRTRQPR